MIRKTKEDAFLFVEGRDDQEVIWELRNAHQLPRNFAVRRPSEGGGSADGIETLLNVFYEQMIADDCKVVGIILDTDSQSQWHRVSARIQDTKLGYKLPNKPDETGTIIDSPDGYAPKVGIWLMPDNQNLGDLESFMEQLIPEADELKPFVEDILNQIESKGIHRYSGKRSKAFIYTWLAWQKEPGISMRKALQSKALSAHSPFASLFVDWLKRLFNR